MTNLRIDEFLLAAVVLATLCAPVPTSGTTYSPVTFTELVTRADVILVGEVTDVRPFVLRTRDGTVIKTRVIFRVQDPLFGTTSALEVFEFLGGEIADIGMEVSGMPRFAVGDRRVIFARRELSINPIVGFTQGLFQVRRDSAGVDRVFMQDGFPLSSPESIGTARLPVSGVAAPMRLTELRDRISRGLVEARRR